MKNYKDIRSYIKAFPDNIKIKLEEIHAIVSAAAPKAEEAIKYGIPTLVQDGNLIHFGGYKSHIGLYPGATGIHAFKEELSKYECSKGTVKFPLDKPLPKSLITKIVKYRIKENAILKKEKLTKK